MTSTYIKIFYQVKDQQYPPHSKKREQLQEFIARLLQDRERQLISVLAGPDHIDLKVGLKEGLSITELVREIKSASSKFLVIKKWVFEKYSWQETPIENTFAGNQMDQIMKYIQKGQKTNSVSSFSSFPRRMM